jgi:hypothetical protein
LLLFNGEASSSILVESLTTHDNKKKNLNLKNKLKASRRRRHALRAQPPLTPPYLLFFGKQHTHTHIYIYIYKLTMAPPFTFTRENNNC